MAASAYAAVVSLRNTMDQFQNHPRLSSTFQQYQNRFLLSNVDFFLDFVKKAVVSILHPVDSPFSTFFSKSQFESLREKVGLFIAFLENCSDADINGVEDLVRRIAAAAHKAEEVIEMVAADRICGRFSRKSLNLRRIIEDMDRIKEKVIKVKKESGLFINSTTPLPPPPPPPSSSPGKITSMVGFNGYLAQLLDQLTGYDPGRQIFPIVGMGGIGKTTLAVHAYESPLILQHFDVRAWVTVSQDYNATAVLSQALSCLGISKSRNQDEVREKLRKTLYSRRYLIVLDDVWCVEAWEEIQFCFPDNCNGSRVVVTTRQQELVDYFASSSSLALDFLDDDDSWELFCARTAGCPAGLEEVGKKIVRKCKGLPLAITVIGGLLGRSPRTQEYWEKIDKSLILEDSGEGNSVLSILYLSYKYLPVWLKSCFLYLGLFPEDHQIYVSEIIQLWIAEGYVKPDANRSLEDVAESYVKDLVDRNLVLPRQTTAYKKLQTCCVHDLVRELCIRLAEKENLYSVQKSAGWFHPRESFVNRESLGRRPPALDGEKGEEAPPKSRLLRVFCGDVHCLINRSSQLGEKRFVMHPRYISCDATMLPSSISLCWSLQTLILEVSFLVVMPPEIWKLHQLRHIEIWPVCLPDPPSDEDSVLENLQTLKNVKNLTLSDEVCRRMPNIKDLVVNYDFEEQGWESWHLNMQNLGCFNKLEILSYSCGGMEYVGENRLQQKLKLPSSLKELILEDCHLVWSDMVTIASLPRLESLSLVGEAVVEEEWNFVEEEFVCLKHLYVSRPYGGLVNWSAESSNFPVLERLSLCHLSELDRIPSGIGEIATLENMYLFDCSETANISAMQILEEQESLGNESLKLQLEFSYEVDAEMCREKIEEMGFTSKNLTFPETFG